VPFVFALSLAGSGERTIVRGVIDCLLDTPAGLILIDYKTDHIRDERDLEERLAGYRVQLQLYALAAGALFERPVARAALAFLRARRIVNVPLDVPGLATLFDLPTASSVQRSAS
jgi:ATP-dependent helicase/nuclease subunit A